MKKSTQPEVADRKFAIRFTQPSLTHQSFAKETNINSIMARFEKTGLIEHLNQRQGQYGDFSDVPDYQSALGQVADAQKMFDDLPAKIRKLFNNQPLEFLEFAQNPDNYGQLVELGLAPPLKDASPVQGQNSSDGPKREEKSSEEAPTPPLDDQKAVSS